MFTRSLPPVLSFVLDRVLEVEENWIFGVYSSLYGKEGAYDGFLAGQHIP
jgi:hypothetical protein